jgi:PhnB protein
MAVKPIPEGYHTVTPYLVVENAARLIEFMKQAFDATEVYRSDLPDGTVMHAEVRVGDSMIMVGQSRGEHKPLPCMLYLYVEDVDGAYKQAVQAGGVSVAEPKDQFYGDRSGGVKDEFGNQWWIGTHIEDVSHEELARRAASAGH